MRSPFAALRSLVWATFRMDIAMISMLRISSSVSPNLSNGDYQHVNSSISAEQDKRAEIPSTRFTPLVEALIQECWARDPEKRPAFRYVAATLKRLRKRQGAAESPGPVHPERLIEFHAWSQLHHPSPNMRPSVLPETSESASQGVQATPGVEASSGAGQVGDSDGAESTSTSSCGLQPKPFRPIGRPCNNPSHHHWEPTMNSDTGIMEMPSGNYPVTVIYTPSRQSSMGDSDTSSTSSHFTSNSGAEHIMLEGVQHQHAYHVSSGSESPLRMNDHLAERRNECRFRSLAQSSHGFHRSRMLSP